MASIIGVETLQHTNGTTAATIDSSGNVTFANRYPKVAIIQDQKSSTTDGGEFANGAWRTRVLNTLVSDDDNIVTLANNAFTLGAGTYIIEWSAPAYNVDRHQSKLYDKTNDANVNWGSSEYSSGTQSRSMSYEQVTITANTSYEIQHKAQTTRATNGLGVQSAFGNISIYTIVKITKIA